MSFYFKEHGKPEKRTYTKHGRTKQSFKDSTDINKILERAAIAGTTSHLEAHGMTYADFSDYDFQSNMMKIAEGQNVFDQLPAEVKREFDQDPDKFFGFVNDPANKETLVEKLPALAKRGTQLPRLGIQTRDPVAAETAETIPEPRAEPQNTAEPK